MGTKTIQISDDTGATWHTLPGNSGTFTVTAAAVDDTIYGQNWKSEAPTILNWKVDANALYKGVSGYSATIKQGGSPTTLTGAATTQIGTSKRDRRAHV